MIIKRVGAMSLAKVAGTLYVFVGLVIGGIVSAVSVIGGAIGGNDAGPFGMLFGAAAVVLIPLFYGCVGAIGSLIGAALFNLVAGIVGGVEIETE